MLDGLYRAAGSMHALMRCQEVSSTNLANVSTSGYRRLRPVLEQTPASGGGGRPRLSVSFVPDMTQGDLCHTGNPLDVALGGEGFFVVETPKGDAYTRDGRLRPNDEGELVTVTNLRVQGESGPIKLPVGADKIEVSEDGAVIADGAVVGKLKRVKFASVADLQPVGFGLFKARRGASPEASDAPVSSQTREASNVRAMSELIHMLTALRTYEANQKVLVTIDENMRRVTQSEA
jgi:flagellar basal-body rod protein FlgG